MARMHDVFHFLYVLCFSTRVPKRPARYTFGQVHILTCAIVDLGKVLLFLGGLCSHYGCYDLDAVLCESARWRSFEVAVIQAD